MSSKYFFNYKKKISSCKLRNHTDLSCLALYLLNQQTYLLLISNPFFVQFTLKLWNPTSRP